MKARYELKYVISSEQRTRLPQLLDSYLVRDPKHPNGYTVNSIYYDTEDFQFYFDKLDGVDPRYKVRIRWYDQGEGPVFFLEAKHRLNQRVYKDRVPIASNHFSQLAEQNAFPLPLLQHTEPPHRLKADILAQLVRRHRLTAQLVVRYERSIFICPKHPDLRVTIDRHLRASGLSDLKRSEGTPFCPPELFVLEFKFNYAVPLWLADAARALQLDLRRYSKYCSALEHLYPGVAHRQVRVQRSV